MKILVTGANGQVGTELVKEATKYNIEVVACTREQLDVTKLENVKVALERYKPDVVINAAAYTAVDKAEREVELAFSINRDGPANLARICHSLKLPLLHISTDYVFDGKKTSSYIESDTTSPLGVYGESKLAGEKAISRMLEQYIILRVSWVFGTYGNNFVKTMLRLAEQKSELSIVSDQKGAPTWARDIANALLLIALNAFKNEEISWGVYHFASNPVTTWSDFAIEIFAKASSQNMLKHAPEVTEITTEEYPTPAQRPLNSQLNCEKLLAAFNIHQPNWQDGLAITLNEWNT